MNKEIEALVVNIEKVIVGKRDSIVKVVCAMLAEGHILIEDVPGGGKTRLVSALASSVSVSHAFVSASSASSGTEYSSLPTSCLPISSDSR